LSFQDTPKTRIGMKILTATWSPSKALLKPWNQTPMNQKPFVHHRKRWNSALTLNLSWQQSLRAVRLLIIYLLFGRYLQRQRQSRVRNSCCLRDQRPYFESSQWRTTRIYLLIMTMSSIEDWISFGQVVPQDSKAYKTNS
jgi:hypothetical protein